MSVKNRYLDEGYRHWQVAILVRHEDCWIYAHAFNKAGTDSAWLGTPLVQQIADSFGIRVKALRYSRKESGNLARKLPFDSE